MLVLAADTSAGHCSVALWRGGETLASISAATTHGHAELLAPMVRDVLARAKTGARNCDRFCAVTGPGSFTGVRVGVSFMRALALAAGGPAFGVDAFSAWALTAEARLGPAPGGCVVALDSRRGTAYVRETPGGGGGGPAPGPAPGPAVEESLGALAARLARAPGARLTGNIAPPGFERAAIDAVDPAAAAAIAARADAKDPAFAPKPYYLRAPDAALPA